PLALRDDLMRGVSLITAPGDPVYAKGFLRSLARAAGDTALAAAVEETHTAFDRAKLARMIEDRLAALSSLA
ncbi:MAG: hypothetical protein U1E06_16935, partial [Tabrizicola sp.]|nr:hypothetical protein [Tabrizicola sp.]